MNTELRALGPEDSFPHRQLMSHAFSQGSVVAPPAPDAPPPDMKGTWGIFDRGTLKAALSIEDYLVHWGADPVLAMGGIAGVATFAEARGRGYVEQLLKQSLVVMKEAGQVISALYPFAFAFYRRYGWDWVGQKRNIKLPLRELKSAPEGREVQLVSGDNLQDALSPGYSDFARRFRGVFTAETHRWKNRLSHDGGKTTYAYQYSPTGAYLLWRYEHETCRVREWTAKTPEEYRALLSLLHYFGTQSTSARVTLPDDTPLPSFLMHWDLHQEIEPVFMGRVVDFAAAMAQLALPEGTPSGSMTLALSDEYAPWNHGAWRLNIEGENALATPLLASDAAEADVTLDIQALSQAFWGKPSLAELRYAQRLSVANEAGYRLLESVLPPATVYTLDDF